MFEYTEIQKKIITIKNFEFKTKKEDEYNFEKTHQTPIVGQLDKETIVTSNLPIALDIYSYGGEVSNLQQILTKLYIYEKKVPVITFTSSIAASAGFRLLVCGTPGYRFMTRSAEVMNHEMQLGYHTDTTRLEQYMAAQKIIDEKWKAKVIQRIGYLYKVNKIQKAKILDALQAKNERYFTAEEMLELNLIDYIIEDEDVGTFLEELYKQHGMDNLLNTLMKSFTATKEEKNAESKKPSKNKKPAKKTNKPSPKTKK